MTGKTIRKQTKTFTKEIEYEGELCDMIVKIRHDDECRNGHNTFAITADIYKHGRRTDRAFLAGGCLHDEIAEHFPEFKSLLKWHLCSTDGPLHYVANSVYHAQEIEPGTRFYTNGKKADLAAARSSAIWPDAELDDFTKEKLLASLPALMVEFRAAVEGLGFEYEASGSLQHAMREAIDANPTRHPASDK